MVDWAGNFAIASEAKEQIVDRMSRTEFPLRSEEAAYKRAHLRAGFEMALAMLGAEEITLEELAHKESSE